MKLSTVSTRVQLKITKYVKKQKNVTHIQEKKHSTETNTKISQMLEFEDKNF